MFSSGLVAPFPLFKMAFLRFSYKVMDSSDTASVLWNVLFLADFSPCTTLAHAPPPPLLSPLPSSFFLLLPILLVLFPISFKTLP